MVKSINLHTITALQHIDVGDGISLVPLRQKHSQAILDILNKDSQIREFVYVASRIHTARDVSDEIRRIKKDSGLIRYVILKNNNVVGLVSLWRDDGFWNEHNLDDYGFGYFLTPEERGKGIVQKSVNRIIRITSESVPINRFVAICEDENVSSVAVLRKLGFRATDDVKSNPHNGRPGRKYEKRT